ncbi:HPr family phosphocarrier protein [Sporosalibacterium faouarense]|uniref:HPr family phosphocarrier protein n=1 Tax=Sporosalibacterium faouarense TaxID=516123 RepID=UPI00141CB195|nr:HPr family phosphocarrier protein [Sporosalibacterium faouarense]MTI47832.1 HPr family phosphocarrier protein [Bacillota bacterium]
MEQLVTIINESGIHARPANLFTKMASKYECEIEIEVGTKKINGKSIMAMMGLGLSKGTEIKLITNGSDEKEAMENLVELVKSGFDEE